MKEDLKTQRSLEAIYDLSESILGMEKIYEGIPFMKKQVLEEKRWMQEIMRCCCPDKNSKDIQAILASFVLEMEQKEVQPIVRNDFEQLYRKVTHYVNL